MVEGVVCYFVTLPIEVAVKPPIFIGVRYGSC